MPLINIRVTGLNEAISFFNTTSSQLQTTNQAVLNEAGDIFVREAKAKAHVITGRMKGSVSKGVVTSNSITVGASAPYSAFENRRLGAKAGQGPHNFADLAARSTVTALPGIIKKHYDKLLHPR